MIAFLPSLGWQEMFLLLVIGLLLYGRNLPEAGRTFGRVVAQLKRGFHQFKEQMDRDESIQEVRKTLQDATRDVRNITAVPRALTDPGSALRTMANDAMHAPAPSESNESDEPDEPPVQTQETVQTQEEVQKQEGA